MTTPAEQPIRRGWRKLTWFVLIVQAVFVAWIIGGSVSASKGTCEGLDQATCDAAKGIGTALGVGMIVVVWLVVDLILLVIWLVTRPRQR